MRRVLVVMVLLLSMALSGCHPLVASIDDQLDVYATFYPIYALIDAVTADVPGTSLHCLVQPQDGCMRSYQLSDWDSYLLTRADVVIAGGRGLESFESLLFGMGNQGPAVSALLYNMELYEGTAKSDREESHLIGPNPHLYMSIDGAGQILQGISATMTALDPGYAERYMKNEESALAALDALRMDIDATAQKTSGLPVALMNEALIYVARDYGLKPVVWIERESGEGLYGDALTDCLARLKQSDAQVVLIERQAPASLVSALKTEGFAVAPMDILSTHHEDEGFETYIQAQMNNANAIIQAYQEIER